MSGEVRGVDYLSAVLALGLGVAWVANVLYLNLRERGPELAALAATGWQRRHLNRMALYAGAGIGLLGSLAGGVAGVALAWALGGALLALTLVASWAASPRHPGRGVR